MGKISRREFLRQAALGAGALLGGTALEGCRRSLLPASSVKTVRPMSAAAATAAPVDQSATRAPTAVETQAQDHSKSKIVRARMDSVWQGEDLSPEGLRRMLDASITALTGKPDSRDAWSSLFAPGERVAIKVNAIINGATHPALALAVAQRLQDVGIKPENIVIYDRTTREIEAADYPVNAGAKGVRFSGTDGDFWDNGDTVETMPVAFSRHLEQIDALINLPVLKGLTFGGISFALKNHYGSINNPSQFHGQNFPLGVLGVNRLPAIHDRTRLVIGDVLNAQTRPDDTNYLVIGGFHSLLASFDPLTVDAVGYQMALKGLEAIGQPTSSTQHLAEPWLKAGTGQGLGESEPDKIDLQEIIL